MAIRQAEIDFKKPYTEVFGADPQVKHKYMQNGKYYDPQGIEIHKDGVKVTPKEKMERAKKEIELLNRKKEEELKRQILKFQKQQDELKKEALEMAINTAANNITRLEDPISSYKTKDEIKMALDMLEFPYEADAAKEALNDILQRIFDAATA